jgi:GNAT superfamily N-acetyltransferase
LISPGWKTDLDILEMSGSKITDFGDHLVVRTPHNPNYHWGNCILVMDPGSAAEAEKWIHRYNEFFPDNQWVAIGLPQMPANVEQWIGHGVTLEQLDVLSTDTLPKKQPLAAGYTARIFQEHDWETLTKRELAEGLSEGGYEPSVIESFVLETNANRKQLVDSGRAAWFGAFFDDEMVANLGMVVCGETGRYQSVETNISHRRKGLASHLLGIAAIWSHERGCKNWVIVAQETNDAGRVYRRAGFSPDVSAVNAYRK